MNIDLIDKIKAKALVEFQSDRKFYTRALVISLLLNMIYPLSVKAELDFPFGKMIDEIFTSKDQDLATYELGYMRCNALIYLMGVTAYQNNKPVDEVQLLQRTSALGYYGYIYHENIHGRAINSDDISTDTVDDYINKYRESVIIKYAGWINENQISISWLTDPKTLISREVRACEKLADGILDQMGIAE